MSLGRERELLALLCPWRRKRSQDGVAQLLGQHELPQLCTSWDILRHESDKSHTILDCVPSTCWSNPVDDQTPLLLVKAKPDKAESQIYCTGSLEGSMCFLGWQVCKHTRDESRHSSFLMKAVTEQEKSEIHRTRREEQKLCRWHSIRKGSSVRSRDSLDYLYVKMTATKLGIRHSAMTQRQVTKPPCALPQQRSKRVPPMGKDV